MSVDRTRTAAVVVLYHPDPEFVRRREAMTAVAARLFEINNSVVNRGVAAALNRGFELARSSGFEWVVAFDQDSEPDHDLVAKSASALAACPEAHRVAVIGSNHRDREGRCHPRGAGAWEERDAVITSGSLYRLDAFATIGPFREELFIDLVDIEWCRRASARGWKVLWSPEPALVHAIGSASEHGLGSLRTATSNHPPERRYYMTRNAILLAGEALGREPGWALATLWRLGKSLALMLLFEAGKGAKLVMAARGALDALRRRLGPLERRSL